MNIFKENPAALLTPLLRYLLIALAGGLISKGYITAEQIDMVAGSLVSIVTIVWLVMVKRKQDTKPKAQ